MLAELGNISFITLLPKIKMKKLIHAIMFVIAIAFGSGAMAYVPEVAPRCIDDICIGQLPSELSEYPVEVVGREMQKSWKDLIGKYPVCFQKNDARGTFISSKGRKVNVRFYPQVGPEGQQYRVGEIQYYEKIQIQNEQVREIFEAKKTPDMKEIALRWYGDHVAVASNGTRWSVKNDDKFVFNLSLRFEAVRPADNGKFMAQPGCAATTPKF